MFLFSEKIDTYIVRNSQQEPKILKALSKETWQKVLNPRMISGAYQGRVLSMISKLIQPKNILEIGTFTGYSAICLAEGISKNVTIYHDRQCERWLRPPWTRCELESPELLALCLKNIRGLKKVKIIDAAFVWTEPHS